MFVIGKREQIENYVERNELQELEPGTLNYQMNVVFGAEPHENMLFIIKVDENITSYKYEGEISEEELEDEEERQSIFGDEMVIDLRIQQGGKKRKSKKSRKVRKSRKSKKSKKSRKVRKSRKSRKVRKAN